MNVLKRTASKRFTTHQIDARINVLENKQKQELKLLKAKIKGWIMF